MAAMDSQTFQQQCNVTLDLIGASLDHEEVPDPTFLYRPVSPLSPDLSRVSSLKSETESQASHQPPNSHSPEVERIAANPMFQDLQRAIHSECQQMTVPFTLISTPVTFPVPYQVRLASLQTQMLQATSSAGDIPELEQLHTFCQQQTYHIEEERNQSFQSSVTTPWLYKSINSYYDHLQHQLVDRIESSLNLLLSCHHRTQQQHSSPTTLPSSHAELARILTGVQKDLDRKKKSPSLNPTAVKIMTLWYQRNEDHPYPTQSTAEVMAKAGGIRAEQVKKWFANKRKRSGNTKPFVDIAKERRRLRTVSSESILFTGSRKSRE